MPSLSTISVPARFRSSVAFVRRIVIAIITAIFFWTLLIMIFENSFIFFPSAYPSGPYEDIRMLSDATEHTFTTEDGVMLHGVLSRADSAVATILFSHGNAGNLSHRLHWLRKMSPLHVNVFMYDYRGYGRSEGNPTEDGIYADARAAYDHLRSIDGIGGTPLVLWGRSLGGAVTVDLATHRHADAMILESTFTSAADMASSAYPFLPFLGRLIRTKLDSRSKIGSLSLPSLHVHGSDDSIVEADLGRTLFEAANGQKSLYMIEGAGHNDTYIVGGDEYLARLKHFLTTVGSR